MVLHFRCQPNCQAKQTADVVCSSQSISKLSDLVVVGRENI